MNRPRRFSDLSIQTRLIVIFLVTTGLIFIVNVFVYINLNQMIGKIEDLYSSNISLNNLSDNLDSIQNSMTQFLKTKNTDSLEEYFKYRQDYQNLLNELDIKTSSADLKQMEKCIVNMSNTYLQVTDDVVSAKRGRSVSKYIKLYDDSSRIYGYLKTYIYSLNNEQFKNSSNNYETLLYSLKFSEVFCLSILVLVAICNILLVILATQSITSPLRLLAKRADEVSEGDFDGELLEVESEDEVGVVTRAFNQMILSIREYIDRVRDSMEKESAMKEKELLMNASLKEAQLKYLQAQINPHFLFNTLNAGAQLAMMEGADRTNTYVQKMADFFRYNIKKNNELVTIKDELQLIDNYIYILNVRFSGEIHYEKDIDESLVDIEMPSMILQPIVENSVNYGIRNIDWEGLISLSLYRDGDRACISIKDNGIGISQDKIDKILADEVLSNENSADSNGIGLSNVINRLDLHFNTDDVFVIKSEGENMGTEVVIRIPVD